jgi:hypothetical protein
MPVDLQSQSTVVTHPSPTYAKPTAFNSYLTTYAVEAIEMAESPVHLLQEIMASEMNADVEKSE